MVPTTNKIQMDKALTIKTETTKFHIENRAFKIMLEWVEISSVWYETRNHERLLYFLEFLCILNKNLS